MRLGNFIGSSPVIFWLSARSPVLGANYTGYGCGQKGVRMILVTGASGFVGSAVAKALLKAGHQVRALVRPTSSRVNLADPRLEIATGDLLDAALDRAGDADIRYRLSCRRRLPAVGAQPRRHRAYQCRGHPAGDGGGATGRRRAHRLYQQRRDAEPTAGRQPERRDFSARPEDRPSAPTNTARSPPNAWSRA